MYLRNGIYYYDFIVRGVRYHGSTGLRDKEKAKLAIERKKIAIQDKASIEMMWEQTKNQLISFSSAPMDSDEIWKCFMQCSGSRASEKRLQSYRVVLNKFVKWIHENHNDVKNVSDVTERIACEWFSEIKSEAGASNTKNGKLQIMKMFFKTLGKSYGVIENPFESIKPVKNNAVERMAFTPEELKLIGERATGWIYSLCVTAISTGLREGDICMLKKSSIDLESGWITLKTRKTDTKIDIPILPGLKTHLIQSLNTPIDEKYIEYSEYVYPELAYKYTHNCNNIGGMVKKFFAEIGIDGASQKMDGRQRVASVKDIHSFRHTFVYLAAVNGIPLPIVQSIVGHASPEMTKHYMDHANKRDKASYLSGMPQYLTGEIVEKPSTKEKLVRIISKMNERQFMRWKHVILKFMK